jgi:hypothetical protein
MESTDSSVTAIKMTATLPKESWFGIGFSGESMVGTELVMMLGPSTPSQVRIISTKAAAHTKPPIPATETPSYTLTSHNPDLNATH